MNWKQKYDEQFRVVFEAIRELMAPEPVPPSRRIGFAIKPAHLLEQVDNGGPLSGVGREFRALMPSIS